MKAIKKRDEVVPSSGVLLRAGHFERNTIADIGVIGQLSRSLGGRLMIVRADECRIWIGLRQQNRRCAMTADNVGDLCAMSLESCFDTVERGDPLADQISREALEAQFRLPGDADPVRMLKTFADGRRRMIAVAERKLRLRPGEPVRLTAVDFQIRQ